MIPEMLRRILVQQKVHLRREPVFNPSAKVSI
jgi:hypothetical protein